MKKMFRVTTFYVRHNSLKRQYFCNALSGHLAYLTFIFENKMLKINKFSKFPRNFKPCKNICNFR